MVFLSMTWVFVKLFSSGWKMLFINKHPCLCPFPVFFKTHLYRNGVASCEFAGLGLNVYCNPPIFLQKCYVPVDKTGCRERFSQSLIVDHFQFPAWRNVQIQRQQQIVGSLSCMISLGACHFETHTLERRRFKYFIP